MRKWRIATLGRTEIYVHPVFFAYLLYASLTGHGLFMALATLSIVLHEAAHGLISACFGQPPHSIEMTPLGAVMRLEDTQGSAFKRALILVAGPTMTILLCLASVHATCHGILPAKIGKMLFLNNVTILILNLLPALPLDGGQLLALILERLFPRHLMLQIMRVISTLLGISMILLNIYASWRLGGWNLSLSFAGCCMIYSAVVSTTPQVLAELQYLIDRKIRFERRQMLQSTIITVQSNMKLKDILRRLPAGKSAVFLGIEAGSMKYIGWLTEHDVVQHYLKHPAHSFADAVKYD